MVGRGYRHPFYLYSALKVEAEFTSPTRHSKNEGGRDQKRSPRSRAPGVGLLVYGSPTHWTGLSIGISRGRADVRGVAPVTVQVAVGGLLVIRPLA
jgi:hypothetical protein